MSTQYGSLGFGIGHGPIKISQKLLGSNSKMSKDNTAQKS